MSASWIEWVVGTIVAWAAAGPALGGLALLLGWNWSERTTQRLAAAHAVGLLLGTLALVGLFVAGEASSVEVVAPPLLEFHGYEWRAALLVDRVSVAYLALVATVYPVIGRFSRAAFHREPGAPRYWFLVMLFGGALAILSLSGNIDVLYLGWELIGLASVMLIAFFRRTPRSVHNSLRALVFYRLGDVGVLGAAVWIHHAFPSAEFARFGEATAVPTGAAVALALLLGTMAKSAQFPLSPWLHRAMEGPAASSAIFYGALSVHLGPFLLLRTSPLWLPHDGVRMLMAGVGLTTALFATLVGRTRPDAKTSLAYAAMAQLGFMYVEIAAGWFDLAMVHLWAHAGLRTWQFLRSSSLIQDFQENPLVTDEVRHRFRSGWERLFPESWRGFLYVAALREFWLDALQQRLVVGPVVGVLRSIAHWEDRTLQAVSGGKERS